MDKKTKVVARWILIGIAMLIIQVLLGGITRLTGSGLSITEWKPIMGAMPPTSQAEWQKAFDHYQQIAQFKYLNQHFTLSDFKFIFFWEWFHRLWARLIGVVFLIPFIYFLVKKYFKDWMVVPLVILFILGALQGAVGWIMVQSGLNENDVYVSHIRLAAHFMAAMVLVAYALIFWLKLIVPPQNIVADRGLFRGAIALVLLVSVQLVYGAFMAGLKAAPAAPTFPDINGAFIPPSAFTQGSFFSDIFHNKLSVHFIHRTLAYLITVLVVIWWMKAIKITSSTSFSKARNLVMTLVLVQVTLGIITVVNGAKMTNGTFGIYEWLALSHQLTGMLLFLSLIAVVYLSGKSVREA